MPQIGGDNISARDDLFNRLCMACVSAGCDLDKVKDSLYIILANYEITDRCTEVALLQEDINEMLVKKFLISKMVKGCSERTVKLYGDEVPKILAKIGKTVDDITSDDIRLYLAKRMRIDGVTNTTADNELRYLRSFFNYLMAEEAVMKNPTLKVDKIKCPKKEVETFSEMEIELLRETAPDERIKCMIEVLFSTGCRVSELVNIKLCEIDDGRILVHGKGNKDRTVYINAKAQIAIANYLKLREDANPYLFAGGYFNNRLGYKLMWWRDKTLVAPNEHLGKGAVEHITRHIGKKLGIRANPHKFRKTCATMALRRGMPIEQVSKMLGHEDIKTTQIYLNIDAKELEHNHKKYVV